MQDVIGRPMREERRRSLTKQLIIPNWFQQITSPPSLFVALLADPQPTMGNYDLHQLEASTAV